VQDRLHQAPASAVLGSAIIAVFVASTVAEELRSWLGLAPSWSAVGDRPWTLLTVTVTTDNLLHVLLALAVIMVFGTRLERVVGSAHLAAVWILSGVAGALAFLAIAAATDYDQVGLGPSAAFLGLLGAVATAPSEVRPDDLPVAKIVVAVLIVNAVGPLVGAGAWVSSLAHVAGLAAGAVYGFTALTAERGSSKR
jgi:membrane associated rhomboid family serine protease